MDSSIRGMHESVAQQRNRSRADVVGHSGVQPWSAGELFPAVISRVEVYESEMPHSARVAMRGAIGYADEQRWLQGSSLESRLISRYWVLDLDGVQDIGYALREDAEAAARFLLDHPERREARRIEAAALGAVAVWGYEVAHVDAAQRARDAGL